MVKLFYAWGEVHCGVEMACYLEGNEMLKTAGARLLHYECPDKKGYAIEIPNAKVRDVLDALMTSAQSWKFTIPETLPQGEAMYEYDDFYNIMSTSFEYMLMCDIMAEYAIVTE